MPETVKIVSWNIRGAGGPNIEPITELLLSQLPDVLVLQEVHQNQRATCHERLGQSGYECVPNKSTTGEKMQHGVLIGVRDPLRLKGWQWCESAPFKQSLLQVTVDTQGPEFDVIGVHIPNYSRHGYKKVKTFEALGEGLEYRTGGRPHIVAGDFNEPYMVKDDGQVIPFGMKTATTNRDGKLKTEGVKGGHPRKRWIDTVLNILGQPPNLPLRHVFREFKKDPAAKHVTHVNNRGPESFFDHILVSKEWTVGEAGYDDTVRLPVGKKKPLSDHSLAWADLVLGGETRRSSA